MNEVNELILSLSDKTPSKQEGVSFYRVGLRVPVVRRLLKENLYFLDGDEKQVLHYWDDVWRNSPYFEAMSMALYFYQYKNLSRLETMKIMSWMDRCTCWEHSDDLSKILAHMREKKPEWVMPTLKKWNKDKNPWKRRQSVVSLLEYASKREVVLSFKELISFVDSLLEDKEYYVQKGVGWTLREIFNLYPLETTQFLEMNLTKLSSIAYSSSTEKLDEVTKLKFNQARKKIRRKG